MGVKFKRTERLNEGYEGKLGVKDDSKPVQLEGWSSYLLKYRRLKLEQVEGTHKEFSIGHVWIKIPVRHPSREVK